MKIHVHFQTHTEAFWTYMFLLKIKIILTENNLTKLYFEEFTEEILVRRHASKNNENTKTINKQLNAFYIDLKQT